MRDGYSVLSELITKTCTSSSVGALYTTSGRYGFLRLVTYGTLEESPFKIRITSVQCTFFLLSRNFLTVTFFPANCGLTIRNATRTPQYITSPDFPNKYPSNIRCSWVILNSEYPAKPIHLKFVIFDLIRTNEDSQACRDRVEILENSVCCIMFTKQFNAYFYFRIE